MKNAIKIFGIAFVLFTLASNVVAQVQVSATATANIIAPLSISKVVDMNFGNVAILNATAGTIILSTADVRTQTGGASPVATPAGVVNAAKFNISGADGYIVTITLPGTCVVSNGAATMNVDTFVSDPVTGFQFNLNNPALMYVGATLNVSGTQAAGVYTSATPFTVTLQYN